MLPGVVPPASLLYLGMVPTVFTRPTLSGYLTKISETRIVLKNFLQYFPGTSNEKQIKIFKGVDG